MRIPRSLALTAVLVLGALASPLATKRAEAHPHVSVGVGIGFGPPVYAAPYYVSPPVIYAPPPVYTVPPPAYYYPPSAVVAYPPAMAYYGQPQGYYLSRPIYSRPYDDDD